MHVVQLGTHPIFRRLRSVRDSRVFTRGREMAEDMRERWETSDSAMVQRIQVGLLCHHLRRSGSQYSLPASAYATDRAHTCSSVAGNH